jgi:integrase
MLKNAFLFAFYTGLRKGDIENLKWKNLPVINSNVELDLITGKKGVRLTYKLPSQATKFLKHRGEENDKVFGGFKYDGYQNEKLRAWVANAGIKKENVGSHTARHSFAVYHLSKGTPIYTLSKLMAHNSVRTTERSYAQYAKEDLNYALDKAFNL